MRSEFRVIVHLKSLNGDDIGQTSSHTFTTVDGKVIDDRRVADQLVKQMKKDAPFAGVEILSVTIQSRKVEDWRNVE